MKIKLQATYVRALSLVHNAASGSEAEVGLGFTTQFMFSKEQSNTFIVSFSIEVPLDDETVMELSYEAKFESDQEMSEEFQKSPFVGVNAPAIAYPYMRAYISTFCALSGFEPVILPTVNFQALYNDVSTQP